MMTSFRLISTSTVRPTSSNYSCSDHTHDDHNDLINPTIELTPWDLSLALQAYSQRGLLFHRPINDHSHDDHNGDMGLVLVDHLKASLSKALDIFYPLAGRLAAVENDDGTATISVVCNGAGATFLHGAIDGVKVADLVGPDYRAVADDAVSSFFPMGGVLNCEAAASKLPLLAVQVTELADGVFVACATNHLVMDGAPFWQFFNVWSEIARRAGRESRHSRPTLVFGREYLRGLIDLPIKIPLSLIKPSQNHKPVPPVALQQRVFRFSREKISALKAKANAEASTDKISSLQALMAHLWLSVTRSRNLSADEQVNHFVVIGMRQRMEPPLPEGYFGNCLTGEMLKSTAGELLVGARGALGRAAREMNRAVAEQSWKEGVKFLQEWAVRPVFTKVGEFPPNVLIAGSSPRFDVFGNDFGWGRPVAVRSGHAGSFDGKMTANEGAEEGSIDFEVFLRPETLKALASDEDFLGTLV